MLSTRKVAKSCLGGIIGLYMLSWNGIGHQLEFAHFLNRNMIVLILLIKLGEGNSFSTIGIILMLGGHAVYPKWVSFFSV
jgi:predicted histidine transporter YuiF (NhaC family)